jgi:hypothetical protein
MTKYSGAGGANDVIARLKGEMGMTEPEPEPCDAEDILARFKAAEESAE